MRELARELDKRSGRARWVLTQRLDAVRQRSEAAMRAELDAAVDGIATAARRARALQQAAAEDRDRHLAAARDQDTLAHRLAALGEGP